VPGGEALPGGEAMLEMADVSIVSFIVFDRLRRRPAAAVSVPHALAPTAPANQVPDLI